MHRLRPDLVVLGLNPSTPKQAVQEGKYANFHSPKLQHRDVDLRIAIEENELNGAYMTDLTTTSTPNSEEIGQGDIRLVDLIEQSEIIGREEVDVICFGRRVFNLLKSHWRVSHETLENNVWGFSYPLDRFEADFYSVYHYSQPDGSYTDELRAQLRYLQSGELL